MKVARLCLIFKSGDQSDFTNYRPISVLPAFSKIFEKVVHARLMTYLVKHCILTENQFGFRNNRDTCLVVAVTDEVNQKLDVCTMQLFFRFIR